jgi:hypothetical protein
MSLRHSELDVCREPCKSKLCLTVGTSCPCCHCCSLVKNRGKLGIEILGSQWGEASMHPKGPRVGAVCSIFWIYCCSQFVVPVKVPTKFPKFPMRSPTCSQYSTSFNPISFALSCTLFYLLFSCGGPPKLLLKKKNYGNSNISLCKNIIFKKILQDIIITL